MMLTYDLWRARIMGGECRWLEADGAITFFLDMAWEPKRFNENNLFQHTVDFCRQQFGGYYAEEAARLIDTYTQVQP